MSCEHEWKRQEGEGTYKFTDENCEVIRFAERADAWREV